MATGAAMQVTPGRSLGFMTLGASLYDILTRVRAQPDIFPSIEFTFSAEQPIKAPIVVSLPKNGIRLRFDGPDQRLRLIEVLDFGMTRLSYRNTDIVKLPDGGIPQIPSGVSGPKFRHVYEKLFGTTYAGEFINPTNGLENGTYVLSYPGLALNFPLLASAWSPSRDFTSLLASSAARPATSMAIFSGESWQKARGSLFTAKPTNPRSLGLLEKGGTETEPDEIEMAKVHGEGRVELIRRSSPSFWITLGETTPQDLVTELGPPDAILNKKDSRLSIHRGQGLDDASPTGPARDRISGFSFSNAHGNGDSFSSMDNEDSNESTDSDIDGPKDDDSSGECFYNYFYHGFDVHISQPGPVSPPSPTAPRREFLDVEAEPTPFPANHLVATKIVLHSNIPGSYLFNRYRRSRWTLEHVPSGPYTDPLTSEMLFPDIQGRLKEVFKGNYANEEQEQSQQRPWKINRAWDNSPENSVELVGGPLEGVGDDERGRQLSDSSGADDAMQDGTELFGFPGLVFEVLGGKSVAALTVY